MIPTHATTPFLVGVTGGSGSGKTALAHAVAAALGPERVAMLGQDAYYRDCSHLPVEVRAAVNFDLPDALDGERFRADLGALRAGRAIVPPRYCYATHRRLGFGDPLPPREIVLVEGLLLLHDRETRALLDLSIFVDAPADVRLARRAARDTTERGRTLQSVIDQCRGSVLPAHARFVESTKAFADLVLLNAGRLDAAAEVALTVITAHSGRRRSAEARAR